MSTIPENLLYSPDHEWVKVEGNIATIGITAFAAGQLGDIVFVEIETEGADLSFGDVFGTVEAVKTVSDLIMPVSGNVSTFNEALEANPELVNKDPYGEGWMIKVEMSDAPDLSNLMNAEAYAAHTAAESH